ncbi:MAG: four helix bundle protein [Crocinitomicaceae bacterium]|nr:four helix bundle protein [Crocinitomicaceae bacterium]
MHRYKDLQFWKKSKQFSVDIYKLTQDFPKSELYGIANQMRRCSVSIPSNIAEGSSRPSDKEFSRFLDIATGSAYELDTQLSIAHELDYLGVKQYDMLNSQLNSIVQMMSKFKSRLK